MLRFRVSDLAKYNFCNKRAKLEVNQTFSTSRAMAVGTHLHKLYSLPIKTFDREIINHHLESMKAYQSFQRVLTLEGEQVLIRGIFDDLRVLLNVGTQEKFVSMVELKTTNHDRLWSNEEAAACFQLKCYIWMVRPYFEKLGYNLWKHHYLEVYSQKTGKLMKRVMVVEDPQMEDSLKHIINSFRGLEKMQVPEHWVCKRCPSETKRRCDWFGRIVK